MNMKTITELEARTVDGGGLLRKKVECPICGYKKTVWVWQCTSAKTSMSMSHWNRNKNYYGACK